MSTTTSAAGNPAQPPRRPDPHAGSPSGGTVRRASRATDQVIIGGVAAGLARHLGLPVTAVRLAFVLTTILGGVGAAYYAGLWLMLPTDAKFDRSTPGLESATRTGKRGGMIDRLTSSGPGLAVIALALGFVFAVQALFGAGALIVPALFGAGGIALLWRQADEAQRERWLDSTGRLDPVRAIFGTGGWAAYARVGAGVVLIGFAVLWFALRSGGVGVARDVLIAVLLGVAGLAIVVGPWLVRLSADLTSERAERVRSQERADLAAHLHDSVLQTLALIQKNSGDAATVARLARAQERDLRSWLYDDEVPADSTLARSLKELAGEIDEAHGVVVDVVSVGDASLDEHLRALVLATRESVTNAAKHGRVERVDVYAEIGSERAEVFVRDRGIGFDPGSISEDRQGVRGSIVGRMTRHGGTATITSRPGAGTEVRLTMPINPEESHD